MLSSVRMVRASPQAPTSPPPAASSVAAPLSPLDLSSARLLPENGGPSSLTSRVFALFLPLSPTLDPPPPASFPPPPPPPPFTSCSPPRLLFFLPYPPPSLRRVHRDRQQGGRAESAARSAVAAQGAHVAEELRDHHDSVHRPLHRPARLRARQGRTAPVPQPLPGQRTGQPRGESPSRCFGGSFEREDSFAQSPLSISHS
jgi:hypothetical protein